MNEEKNIEVVSNPAPPGNDKTRVIVNAIGIALCVILLPILIMNCILIVKGMVNPNEVPSIGGRIPLIVLTGSMEDTIKKGDLIICKKIDAKDVKKDDVISFFDPEGNGSSVVTHRVTRVDVDEETGKISFRVQGDNNNLEDRLSVPAENLVGIWIEDARIGLLGYVVVFTQSTWGLIVCIFLPIGLFVGVEVWQRHKKDKSKQSEVDALKAELEALKKEKEQADKGE